jgi:hypothetical protein
MADDDSPRNADFVGRVVSDAKNPPETRMLTGWLGDAADEGYRRLYTDAELSAYVDIPADAILYTEAIRDVQPSGGVFVWVKRDSALKPGGSASSRAARFLQGRIQQDYASGGAAAAASPGGQGGQDFAKAGFRCVTQVPCGEPTGFSGQCTQQPEVGGAWPCITAIPHCAEPTGFTGQCTYQPWPNPTHYIGCTFFHCPTQDLTHIPRICNIVATGVPGCPVVDPRAGGIDPAKVGVAAAGDEGGGSPADRPAVPLTSLAGCGYTETWGLCETHLLGCGFTKQSGHQCPTQFPGCGETRDCPTTMPGCGWSKNPICTDLPGCGFTQHWGLCQQTQPPGCHVSVDVPCITQDWACRGGLPGGGQFAAFGAPAAGPGARVVASQTVQCNPSIVDACPTRIRGCQTQLPTALCTQIPEACPFTKLPEACPPTSCGPNCQTQQPDCTLVHCVATAQQECTQAGTNCTQYVGCATMLQGAQCPTNPLIDCTLPCTHLGTGCPSANICPIDTMVAPACLPGGARAFAAAGRIGPIGPSAFVGCTQSGPQCVTFPSGDCTFFGCTQSGPRCPTYPDGDCTFFGCPSIGARAGAAGPIAGCTQSGPQCPTHAQPHCTFAGPACPPTPATVCTQFAPCRTHQPPCTHQGPQCPTRQFECTMFCTRDAPGCPPFTRTFQCSG